MRQLFQNKTYTLFSIAGLVILLFVFLPLFRTLISSPADALVDNLCDGEVRGAIWLSIYAGLLATVVGFCLGIPLAYVLARFDFPGKGVIEGLIDLPIVVPHTAAGIALLLVFSQGFFVGKAFHFMGIDFVNATPGIVIAMLFVSIPFLVNSAKEGFKGVDPRLEKVARSLGASPWQTFVRISFPLAWRSILSGAVMMWARGISEFGAVTIMAYYPMVAPTLIWDRFDAYGLQSAQPITVLFLLVCLIIFISLRAIVVRGRKA